MHLFAPVLVYRTAALESLPFVAGIDAGPGEPVSAAALLAKYAVDIEYYLPFCHPAGIDVVRVGGSDGLGLGLVDVILVVGEPMQEDWVPSRLRMPLASSFVVCVAGAVVEGLESDWTAW